VCPEKKFVKSLCKGSFKGLGQWRHVDCAQATRREGVESDSARDRPSHMQNASGERGVRGMILLQNTDDKQHHESITSTTPANSISSIPLSRKQTHQTSSLVLLNHPLHDPLSFPIINLIVRLQAVGLHELLPPAKGIENVAAGSG